MHLSPADLQQTAFHRLTAIPDLLIGRNAPLSEYTRFGLGGPASLLVETRNPEAFREALEMAAEAEWPRLVIGGGTNLVVSDAGFDGVVLRYGGALIQVDRTRVHVQAGAVLQDLVDATVAAGLSGMHTMTGIPGYVGGALYGNAGAYGHSIHEFVRSVQATDGKQLRAFDNGECGFFYRESMFKSHKQWVILAADLELIRGDEAELRSAANEIRTVRDKKYPPTMKCAGSIFKNLLFTQLPSHVQSVLPPSIVREGKVPSAWFLEQTGIRGFRVGHIQVASYHANLIYNDGAGTAADLLRVIDECKSRVSTQFGFDLEEEVQYVGFTPVTVAA